jgi:ParB/RepB/Spo0J family partition protein
MAKASKLAALRAGIRASVGEMGETAQREAQKTENLQRAERANWATLSHESIVPDADQPRKFFDEEKLRAMAESIRAVGLREPLRVYPTAWGGKFRILDGQRRWHALAMLLEEGLEEYREVAVLVDEPPADEARLRVDQLVTSLHKEVFVPLETASVLLEIAIKAGGGEPLTAVRLAERFGFNAKYIERHLKVARGLREGERALLLDRYPKAPLDPLEKLVGWLNSAVGASLDDETRSRALDAFIEHRPAGKHVEAVLRQVTARRAPGRPPRAQFKAGRTGDGGFAVSFRIPPARAADDAVLEQAERELQRALEELRRFRRERGGPS